MSKSSLVLLALAALTSACGASRFGGEGLRASIDVDEVARYDRLIDAGLDAYEAELEAAAHQRYATRRAALDAARDLGSESRMIHHIRVSLASEGLRVEHLCHFSADHPGYANAQRAVYRERMDEWAHLLDAIAEAPVDGSERGASLTASLSVADHGDG